MRKPQPPCRQTHPPAPPASANHAPETARPPQALPLPCSCGKLRVDVAASGYDAKQLDVGMKNWDGKYLKKMVGAGAVVAVANGELKRRGMV